jgi:hypothetical protein
MDEWYAVIHPKIWNGYWSVGRVVPFFRWLGRRLHSRRIYWLGFQVQWITGLKDMGMKWFGGYGQADEIGKRMTETIDELAEIATK